MVKVRSPLHSEAVSGTVNNLTYRDYGDRKSAQLPRRNVKRPLTQKRQAQIGYFTDAAKLYRFLCELRAEYRFTNFRRQPRPEQIITPKELLTAMSGTTGATYNYFQSVISTWDYVSLREINERWDEADETIRETHTAIETATLAQTPPWIPTFSPPPAAVGATALMIDEIIKRDFRRQSDEFGDRYQEYEIYEVSE